MATSHTRQPAIFALQNERDAVERNSRVEQYEEELAASLGLSAYDVHLSSGGTTTPDGDSQEDG